MRIVRRAKRWWDRPKVLQRARKALAKWFIVGVLTIAFVLGLVVFFAVKIAS